MQAEPGTLLRQHPRAPARLGTRPLPSRLTGEGPPSGPQAPYRPATLGSVGVPMRAGSAMSFSMSSGSTGTNPERFS